MYKCFQFRKVQILSIGTVLKANFAGKNVNMNEELKFLLMRVENNVEK